MRRLAGLTTARRVAYSKCEPAASLGTGSPRPPRLGRFMPPEALTLTPWNARGSALCECYPPLARRHCQGIRALNLEGRVLLPLSRLSRLNHRMKTTPKKKPGLDSSPGSHLPGLHSAQVPFGDADNPGRSSDLSLIRPPSHTPPGGRSSQWRVRPESPKVLTPEGSELQRWVRPRI
jgi:hypothetical protein